MDGVTGTERRTDDLLRRAAEDAGQTPEEHYNALAATFAQKRASFEADRTDAGAAGKLLGLGAAKVAGAKGTTAVEAAADLASARIGVAAITWRAAAAGNFIVGTIGMAYELLDEGLIRPNAQADALRSAAGNDAMIVGMSHALDMPHAFKAAVARLRPEVATKGGAAVAAQFAGKDANALPLLQYRADDGLSSAKPWADRIADARSDEERTLVMRELQSSPVGRHATQDAAYGLGVCEALWAAGAKIRGELRPGDYEALFTTASARLDATRGPTSIGG